MADSKVYQGACHCGVVKFEVEGEVEGVMECNCSYCGIKRLMLTFVEQERVRVLEGEENLNVYRFNTETINHMFCKFCGVQPFSKSENFSQMAVNVSCLEGFDCEGIVVDKFNGKDR